MADAKRLLILNAKLVIWLGAPPDVRFEAIPHYRRLDDSGYADADSGLKALWAFEVAVEQSPAFTWEAILGSEIIVHPGETLEFITRETTTPIPDCTQPFGEEHFPGRYRQDPCRFCGERLDPMRMGDVSVWRVTASSQGATV